MDTSGETPYNLHSVNTEVITIDNCEFNGNTAFASNEENGYIASGLTIVTSNPVNIEIKNCRFDGNNSAWSHMGTLAIWSEDDADFADLFGIKEG